ncbi:hypothetical protein ACGFSI_20745 [Streptomyces virginiae]|uniref:hypothetical protein n=1 Tax=Streptomyces virginiae TaxID=1961 RepID=UPI00371BA3B3
MSPALDTAVLQAALGRALAAGPAGAVRGRPAAAPVRDDIHAWDTLARLLREGSKAHRQRTTFARRDYLSDVLHHLADATEAA